MTVTIISPFLCTDIQLIVFSFCQASSVLSPLLELKDKGQWKSITQKVHIGSTTGSYLGRVQQGVRAGGGCYWEGFHPQLLLRRKKAIQEVRTVAAGFQGLDYRYAPRRVRSALETLQDVTVLSSPVQPYLLCSSVCSGQNLLLLSLPSLGGHYSA